MGSKGEVTKVFMGTDMEGVAGVVSFESQVYANSKGEEASRKLATGEFNAAVQGLVVAGIEDILVCDGHGAGAVVHEELHPAAKLMHGRPPAPRHVRDAIVATYDACVMIGQHAMAGGATANLNHTQNSLTIESYRLNGRLIGEIAQFALYQGALGLPLIFLSGDEAACEEVRELVPNVVAVAVKRGLSRNSAISLSAKTARDLIRTGIRGAVERHRREPIAPLVWQKPLPNDSPAGRE